MSSITGEPDKNRVKAEHLILSELEDDTDFLVLPEVWTVGWSCEDFPSSAENISDSKTVKLLSDIARKKNVNIFGGSFIEKRENGKLYNTCPIIDKSGKLKAIYSKMHLYSYCGCKEGSYITEGENPVMVELDGIKTGVTICYDIRFPESSRIPALAGAKVIFNPASFNMTTGPAHWEVAFRQRAIENQVYMVGTATAQDPDAGYTAYGHSIITDPWGRVLMQMDEKEGHTITEIDLDYIDEVRQKLPLLSARRTDIYELRKFVL